MIIGDGGGSSYSDKSSNFCPYQCNDRQDLINTLKSWHKWNLDNRCFCFHLKDGSLIEVYKDNVYDFQIREDYLLINTSDDTPYLIKLSEIVYVNLIIRQTYKQPSSVIMAQEDKLRQQRWNLNPMTQCGVKDFSEF